MANNETFTKEEMEKAIRKYSTSDKWFEEDFRNTNVEKEVVLNLKKFINERMVTFVKNNQNGDILRIYDSCITDEGNKKSF